VGDPATDDDRAPFAADEWPYLQLADRLEDRIRKGEFGEDGKLPTADELAERYGVKISVIRHARKELLHRNVAEFRAWQGYFARAAAPRNQSAADGATSFTGSRAGGGAGRGGERRRVAAGGAVAAGAAWRDGRRQ
jgi:DNA-binding GntR family transcriptional regulator